MTTTAAFIEITNGSVVAQLDVVGAGLRSLEVDGVALVHSYDTHALDGGAPNAAGATLFPWPNRVRDGRWRWNGENQQLVVTEPARSTANHGLVRTRAFVVEQRSEASATLTRVISGEPGYPFDLRFSVTYTVGADGLTVRYDAANMGQADAPLALGAHPYLRVGAATADDLILQTTARTVLDFDDRLLPAGERAATGTADDSHDLVVRGRELNHCFGKLRPEPGGGYLHRLTAPDGRAVELRTDRRFGWLQVYVCDDFDLDGRGVRAIALEPMTAPPDAFNSARNLAVLKPGEIWQATWSLALAPAVARTTGQG